MMICLSQREAPTVTLCFDIDPLFSLLCFLFSLLIPACRTPLDNCL